MACLQWCNFSKYIESILWSIKIILEKLCHKERYNSFDLQVMYTCHWKNSTFWIMVHSIIVLTLDLKFGMASYRLTLSPHRVLYGKNLHKEWLKNTKIPCGTLSEDCHLIRRQAVSQLMQVQVCIMPHINAPSQQRIPNSALYWGPLIGTEIYQIWTWHSDI